MLAVQVQYWTLQENIRHNKVSEDLGYKNLDEVRRHNIVSENETQRHNVVTEDETHRHNLAQEANWSSVLSETVRHDVVTEGQGAQRIALDALNTEVAQRNAATNAMNAETGRFNAVTGYMLGLDANRIAQENADTNARNADTRWLEWTTGSTKAATEVERTDIQRGQLNLGYDNLGEKQRQYDTDVKFRMYEDIERTFMDSWHNANDTLKSALNAMSNNN